MDGSKIKILILFFSLVNCQKILASTDDFYIQLKKNSTEIEIGRYSVNKSKQEKIHQFKTDSIDFIELKKILPIDEEKKTLIFIHAMWGNGKGSQKSNLKTIQKLCGSDYQVINIIWKAGGLHYKKNWQKAIEKGKTLAKIFEYLTANKNGEYNVFCHSMGNRIFEGMIAGSKNETYFKNIILMAADLDSNVFDKNLNPLRYNAENINIYINQKDRALRFSKKRHKRNRLGLNGIADNQENQINLKVIEVSHTKAKGSKGITQHLYFKKDKKVVADLQRIFSEDIENRELKLMNKSLNLYRL